MTTVMLQIPETTSVALGLSPQRVGDALLLAAAVQWFESGKLSSGAAADLAGLSKPVFMERLKDFGVPAFRQTEEELREEIANA
jgi:predicted HTH domain antitoxin